MRVGAFLRQQVAVFAVLLFVVFFALIATEAVGTATTIYVPDDYPTIQAAVNAAVSGDTIIVRDGTYTENVDVNKDNLTIRSENGAETTIVQAKDASEAVFLVRASNVNIRCMGIEGSHGYSTGGVHLDYGGYCTISGNTISENSHGVMVECNYNIVEGNTIIQNDWYGGDGIWLTCYATHNQIRGNYISDNGIGVSIFGASNEITGNTFVDNIESAIELYVQSYCTGNVITGNALLKDLVDIDVGTEEDIDYVTTNVIDSTNTVDGNPIYFWKDRNGGTVPLSAGQVILVNSRHISIEAQVMEYSARMYSFSAPMPLLIQLLGCSSCTINENIVDGTIGLEYTADTEVINNDVESIWLSNSNYNIVGANSGSGIFLWTSDDNIILANTITDLFPSSVSDSYGIYLRGSSENAIRNNAVSNRTRGINLGPWYDQHSSENTIYCNNFFDNSNNCASAEFQNVWNCREIANYSYRGGTYVSRLGNYWDDYTGSDASGDGIGDTPHSINSDDDNYPLMEPFEHYILLEDTGTVTGRVTDDSTGEGIAGATVEAEGPIIGPLSTKEEASPAQAGASYSTTTDANGDYTLYLPEGDYGMTAAAEGYELGMGGATVTAGETTEVNFSLVSTADTTPPALVQNFSASDGEDSQSTLHWDDPPDTDLAEVVVRRKTGGYPTDHTDGTLVYQDTSPAPGKDVVYIDTGLTNGETYYYAVFSRDATGNWDDQVEEGKNADTGIPSVEKHPPIARVSDISGQPEVMYPDTVYTVTAKYYDPDGREDLKYCCLRLNHPSKSLTMMWYQSDGHAAPWAGEEGENYLTITNVDVTEIVGGSEGYELTWHFLINDRWPQMENAIDFGVFASDDGDLESGWDYDDANASFLTDTAPPALIQDFTASDGEDSQSVLTWTNPPDSDLDRVIVKRKTTGYPSSHTDGDTRITIDSATPSREETFVDGGLTNGQIYYYAVFSCDTTGNWNDDWEERENADTGNPYTGTRIIVPYYYQDATQWCWATSLAMLLKYFSFDIEPWDIAATFDASPETGLNFWWGTSKFHEYLEEHYDNGYEDAWQVDLAVVNERWRTTIINALRWGSPVWMGLPGVGHAIVVVGCSGNRPSDYVYFHDPGGIDDLTGEMIFQWMTWRKFFATIDWWVGNIDAKLIYGHSGVFRGTDNGLSISLLPVRVDQPPYDYPLMFKEDGSSLRFDWDGREEHGYKYQALGSAFPSDPVLGYAATLDSRISLSSFIANANLGPVKVLVKAEVYKLSSNTSLFGNEVELVLPACDHGEVTLFDAISLSSFITEAGSYKLLLSIIDGVTSNVCDTCSIQFRVAAPTPTGSDVRVDFPNEKGSVTFDAVGEPGDTNVAEIDPSSHDTGNIQVLGKAYSIDTTATFTGGVTISIHYDDSGLTLTQEKNLKMYKVVDTPWWNWWEDRIDITQSVDTVANVITGRTDTFSTFLTGYEVGTVPEGKLINHGPNPVPAEGCIFWLNLPDDTVNATLKIFDIDGALLVSIPLDPTADRYPAAERWIPQDDLGRLIGTGLYLYLVAVEHTDGTTSYSPVQKMVIKR